MKLTEILLTFFVLLFLSSCSNPKKDYEPIQQLQNTTEQSIQSMSDDSSKLKYCDTVITALLEFMKNHPDGEWNITAKKAYTHWALKKTFIQRIINQKLESEQDITTRKDFEELQKLQDAAFQVMYHSTDDSVRMKNCDDIINTLQNYISKHSEGYYTTSVKGALLSWEDRKTTQELNPQYNSLYAKMKDRAILEAKRVHRMSTIEDIQLGGRGRKWIEPNIQVIVDYFIRMRLKFFGTYIYKLKITVKGDIDPATKRVFVEDNVKVEE